VNTKNISSSSIDEGEIDQLAAQLRRNLADQSDDKENKLDKEVQAKSEPLKNQEKNKENNFNTLSHKDKIKPQPTVLKDKYAKNDEADTIYIDQEGELHLKDEDSTH
jgi:hypothetical protein